MITIIFGGFMLTGVFGTGALIQTDINLILQVTILIIIVVSLVYKSKRKFRKHGELMGIAVILNLISLFAIMLPSFSKNSDYFRTATSELGVQTIWVHAVLGAIALMLGMFLVAAWALHPSNIASCSKRKRIMDITTLLWLISLMFGIAAYIVFYV